MTRVVFVDLETTGLLANVHEIWECGAVSVDFSEDGRYNPFDIRYFEQQVGCTLLNADAEALKVGDYDGRFDEHRAWAAADFIHDFMEFVDGGVLAACNVAFDVSFLKRYASAYNERESWHYSPIDIKSYTAGVLGCPFPIPKTSALADMLNIAKPLNRHTALADAQYGMDIYLAAWNRSRVRNDSPGNAYGGFDAASSV